MQFGMQFGMQCSMQFAMQFGSPTSRNLPRSQRRIQIGVRLQIWLQILEFAVQDILECILEFAVQEILEFRRFEKYREPLSGAQMSQLARARCASGKVDWEDACPHSAGSETPSEKRTGSKRFREKLRRVRVLGDMQHPLPRAQASSTRVRPPACSSQRTPPRHLRQGGTRSHGGGPRLLTSGRLGGTCPTLPRRPT